MVDSRHPDMVEDFGPYRIVRRIAVGGMAEIYLARQRSLEGLERTVAWICGIDHIRETSPFPRTLNRMNP